MELNPSELKDNAFFTSCIEKFNNTLYEDVTAMINSTVPMLIDGDALVICAMLHDSHPIALGNQFLHIAYTCERFLDVLMQKGANCILVFFDLWELAWKDNLPLRTLRRAMYHHFKSNTMIPTYSFLWYCAPEFQDFKGAEKPRGILSNLDFIWSIRNFNEKCQRNDFWLNVDCATTLFASSLVYCISTDLPIVDIDHLAVGVTLIHSFCTDIEPIDSETYHKCTDLLNVIPAYDTVTPKQITINTNEIKTTRDLILQAAAYFLDTYENLEEAKSLLLYYAVKFSLELENRAPPKVKVNEELLKKLQDLIDRWHNCLNTTLYNIQIAHIDFDFQHIADMWQGTLFVCILSLTKDPIQNGTQLGPLHHEYESLIEDLNLKFRNYAHIQPYPVEPIIQGNVDTLQVEERSYEMVKLTKIDNPLIDKFCEDMFDQVLWEDPAKVLHQTQLVENNEHWHHKKPTQNVFQINLQQTKRIHSSKFADRAFQKEFRFTTLYGESLEGKTTTYDAIIYQAPKGSKAPVKKQSQSSKLMQQKICAEKAKVALENDKKELRKFKEEISTTSSTKQLKDKLHYITNVTSRMNSPQTILKGYILKLKVLQAIILREMIENKINCIKEIFLVIRTILRMRDEKNIQIEINDKDKKYVSKLLHLYGFGEIAQRNKLPTDEAYKEEYQYNWIRFQLEILSADLLQDNSASFDPDINFAPDNWQLEFIEAIRRNESALVIAPTSSGKTFACYYCMKRVLQNSLNGIVVYVAPTKPLVNQVAATVTHRFKNAKLPEEGISLVGSYTGDHQRNVLSSRILITVPQCLNGLLMNPAHYNWCKKIKYVIFDEVHRLSGSEEGLLWEHLLLMVKCPFLALSATISDSNLFYRWLQNIEHFKKEQDTINDCLRESYRVRCIVHEERHADLTKYVYTPGHLQHYHPYCTLHNKILLDRGKIPESITLSAKETIQLYDVLSTYAKQYMPAQLDYLEFFDNRTESGFITRKSVREYEKELGQIFYRVFKEDDNVYMIILNKLTPPGYEGSFTGHTSLKDGCMLLNHMADNNMLPAIVFTYNRKLVENFCEALLPEGNSVDDEKSRKDRKVDKLKQKLKQKRKENARRDKDPFDDEGDSQLPDSLDSQKTPINILAHTTSKFKGVGIVDRDDLELIERRLYFAYLKHTEADFRDLIIAQLQNGLAYHHAGADKKLRDTAEMLFRLGILKVVVATGTLAVGVHMPCKSVVIFGDSPNLNSLEYHQMSGRAGRRGLTNEGNVIFLNLTKKRHDMLMTDKLPKMLGNFPINVTLIARLLRLVSDAENEKIPSDEYVKISVSKALTLLENSLIFEVKPHLKQQVKYFVGFALQLLLIQQIINTKGIPTIWCSIVIPLHNHEPGNLALVYLIRCGALLDLVKSTKDDDDLQWKLMVVLCHLFTKVPLSEKHSKGEFKNSVGILEPLPESINQALSCYNKEVYFVFNQYFLSVARHLRPSLGEDNTLPLSKVEFNIKKCVLPDDGTVTLMHRIRQACNHREITSAFVALSGNEDGGLQTHRLISNIRHEICPEINVVPEILTSGKLNAYALDFYRHGSTAALTRENKLRQGYDFSQLLEFRLILISIVIALEDLKLEGAENARLLSCFTSIRDNFDCLFRKAYSNKKI